jgi:hypothetical protein
MRIPQAAKFLFMRKRDKKRDYVAMDESPAPSTTASSWARLSGGFGVKMA